MWTGYLVCQKNTADVIKDPEMGMVWTIQVGPSLEADWTEAARVPGLDAERAKEQILHYSLWEEPAPITPRF